MLRHISDFKQSAAQTLQSGEKVQFPENIFSLQMKDQIKAEKVLAEVNRQDIMREKQMEQKSKEMTRDAQASNFNQILANQTAIIAKDRRRAGTRNLTYSNTSDQVTKYPQYATVKIPDVVQ